MAKSYLVDIGMNDSLPDVVRKCNANFRRLSFDARADSKSGIRREADRADAAIKGAIGEINQALEDAERRIDEKVDEAIAEIEEKISSLEGSIGSIDTAPPVGTWMFCDSDPNTLYPGTTWVRVAQGTFLMASGANYANGGKYGSNTHTLTVNEMPSHRHGSFFAAGNGVADYLTAYGQNSLVAYTYAQAPAEWDVIAGNGGSQPHNNIPQSIAAPLWHRTA